MIIGVDIGGTKTLVALFSNDGKIEKEEHFPTSEDYSTFIADLTKCVSRYAVSDVTAVCVAVPGRLDREKGIVLALGNLPWKNEHIRDDIAAALNVATVIIENDSKLAGFAEAKAIDSSYNRVYYITISTGIGGTLLVDGAISQDVIDGEIGKVPFPHNGELVHWEDFASGRSFFEAYNSKAKDVTDPTVWEEFAPNIGLGLSMICTLYQVEVLVFGGGLGQYLDRFKPYLTPFVDDYLHATITRPKALLEAHYGEESVIYGCYEFAKAKLA